MVVNKSVAYLIKLLINKFFFIPILALIFFATAYLFSLNILIWQDAMKH